MAVRTLEPPIAWHLQWKLESLRALLAGWRYATTRPGRDLRLDLLRGLCVFAMVVDHIGGTSWLYAITGGNTSLVSAAEGFVFLSGLVMGLVYREKIARLGLRAATWTALQRGKTLYLLTVALTLLFAAVTAWTSLSMWVDRSHGLGTDSWSDLVVGAVTLHYTWHGTDILALYTVLVTVSPLVFFLVAEGRTRWVLGASWGLWALHQLYPSYAVVPWKIQNSENFPLAAWQALFITALVVGYHRREIETWLQDLASRACSPQALPRPGLVGLGIVALIVAWVWGAQSVAAISPGGALPVVPDPFDKPNLGPGRLLLFLGLAGVALAATTYAWRPISAAVGWALIPLGQASLYVYAMHLILILACYNVPPYVGSDQPGWELHNTIGQLGIVLLLWAMVKTRFLYGLVPR